MYVLSFQIKILYRQANRSYLFTWRFLQLDELFITEVRAVVYELEGVRGAAVRAVRRLRHAAAL